MKKILLVLCLLVFSTNIYAAQTYYKYLKYKNYRSNPPKKTFVEIFQQNPFYIGLGYGVVLENTTKFEENYEDSNFPKLSNLNQQASLFAGYNINSFLAIELEYYFSGKTPSEEVSYFDSIQGDVNAKNNYNQKSMYFTNLVIKFPYLYKHIPFVKLGVGYSKISISQTHVVQGSWEPRITNYLFETKNILLKAGLGYEYMFNAQHSVLLEYDYFAVPNKLDLKKTFLVSGHHYSDTTTNFKDVASLSYSKVNVAYKLSF